MKDLKNVILLSIIRKILVIGIPAYIIMHCVYLMLLMNIIDFSWKKNSFIAAFNYDAIFILVLLSIFIILKFFKIEYTSKSSMRESALKEIAILLNDVTKMYEQLEQTRDEIKLREQLFRWKENAIILLKKSVNKVESEKFKKKTIDYKLTADTYNILCIEFETYIAFLEVLENEISKDSEKIFTQKEETIKYENNGLLKVLYGINEFFKNNIFGIIFLGIIASLIACVIWDEYKQKKAILNKEQVNITSEQIKSAAPIKILNR